MGKFQMKVFRKGGIANGTKRNENATAIIENTI